MKTEPYRFYLRLFYFFLSISLIALEVLAYLKSGIFSIIAVRIWLLWGIYTLFYSLLIVTSQLNFDIRHKRFFPVFALIFVTFILSFKLVDFPLFLSGETSQQIDAGLQNWEKPDFGYTGTVYLGFPARQFLLISLPTLLTGISVFNYRIIYLLFFIIGIYVFYAGAGLYYRDNLNSDKLITLALLTLPAFPLIQLLSRLFDLPILPPAFFLMTIGLFLIAFKKQRFMDFAALSWSLVMLLNTYTPALSAWALMTVLIFFVSLNFLFREKTVKQKIESFLPWFSVTLLSVFYALTSFSERQDIRIQSPGNTGISVVFSKITAYFMYTFLKNTDMWNNHLLFMGHLMLLPVLLLLIGSLIYLWGARYLLSALWVITTIIVASISRGYSNPPPENSLYRLLIIIPVLILGLLDLGFKLKVKVSGKIFTLLTVIFCLYALSITWEIYANWNGSNDLRPLVLREALVVAGKSKIPLTAKIQIGEFTSRSEISLMREHLLYFFPDNVILDPDNCLTDFNPKDNAVIFYDAKSCAGPILENNESFKKSVFNFQGVKISGIKIAVYKK